MSTKPNQSLYPFGMNPETEPRVVFDAITDAPGSEKYQVVVEITAQKFYGEPGPQTTYTVALATHSDVLQYHEDRIADKTVRPTSYHGIFDYRGPTKSNEDRVIDATRSTLAKTTDQLDKAANNKTKARRNGIIGGTFGLASAGIATAVVAKTNEIMTDTEAGVFTFSSIVFMVSAMTAAFSYKEYRQARDEITHLKPVEKRLSKFLGAVSTSGLKLTRTRTEE